MDDPTTLQDVRTSRLLANFERTKSRPSPKFGYAILLGSGRIILDLLWRESVGFTLKARLRDEKLALPGDRVLPIWNYHMIAAMKNMRHSIDKQSNRVFKSEFYTIIHHVWQMTTRRDIAAYQELAIGAEVRTLR